MDPTSALSGLFSLPFLILCMIIGLAVTGIRKIIEFAGKKIAPNFPDKYEKKLEWFWRETVLPAMPLVIGGLFGFFFKDYPYPEQFTSGSATVFIGVIAGLFSGFLYPRVMFYLRKAMPKKVDTVVSEKIPSLAENHEEAEKVVEDITE